MGLKLQVLRSNHLSEADVVPCVARFSLESIQEVYFSLSLSRTLFCKISTGMKGKQILVLPHQRQKPEMTQLLLQINSLKIV